MIPKEILRDVLHSFSLEDMEVFMGLIRDEQDIMLKETVKVIKMYESTSWLKGATRAIDFWYETKKRIDDLL